MGQRDDRSQNHFLLLSVECIRRMYQFSTLHEVGDSVDNNGSFSLYSLARVGIARNPLRIRGSSMAVRYLRTGPRVRRKGAKSASIAS